MPCPPVVPSRSGQIVRSIPVPLTSGLAHLNMPATETMPVEGSIRTAFVFMVGCEPRARGSQLSILVSTMGALIVSSLAPSRTALFWSTTAQSVSVARTATRLRLQQSQLITFDFIASPLHTGRCFRFIATDSTRVVVQKDGLYFFLNLHRVRITHLLRQLYLVFGIFVSVVCKEVQTSGQTRVV